MQAAITAAERGFEAEVWEKADKVGGALLAAGAPGFKADVTKIVSFQYERTSFTVFCT